MRSADPIGLGLVAGTVLDGLFGDPRRGHPVAGFGRLATDLERRLYRPRAGAGAAHTLLSVGVALAPALLAQRVSRRRPRLRASAAAALTWAVLGAASLRREARALGAELQDGRLDAARRRLPSLCGRDPAALDAAALTRAALESVAENTNDAVVAPLLWGALAGLPGLAAYRAVNTLDAMVGRRSPRYRRFGMPAARLDDAAGFLPARLGACAAALLAFTVGGDPRAALRAWRRDAAAHPSPNAGVMESTFAGALGVELGGPLRYEHGTEHRPVLNPGGRLPGAADLQRAVRLSAAVSVAAALLAAAGRHAVSSHPGSLRTGPRRPA